MKRNITHIILVITTILISGCTSTKVAGIYDAKNGDMILIERDGIVSWSPLSKTQDDFHHLGILDYDEEENHAFLAMASAHPLLFTQLEFSDDIQTVKVIWETRFPELIEDKATVYNKRN